MIWTNYFASGKNDYFLKSHPIVALGCPFWHLGEKVLTVFFEPLGETLTKSCKFSLIIGLKKIVLIHLTDDCHVTLVALFAFMTALAWSHTSLIKVNEKKTEKQTLCINDAFVLSEGQMMSEWINRGFVGITLVKSGGRTE